MRSPDPKVVIWGRVVRAERRRQDLTQEALAARAGLHPNQIQRLERATGDVRLSTALRAVAGLGVSLSTLFAETDL